MKNEKRLYKADDGKLIVRKADGFIMGDGICLGTHDSIENYEEREYDAETIAKYKPEKKQVERPQRKGGKNASKKG